MARAAVGVWAVVVGVGVACEVADLPPPDDTTMAPPQDMTQDMTMAPPVSRAGPVVDGPLPDGRCHGLDAAAAPLVMDQIAAKLPDLAGGMLTDGTYHLTRYEWFDHKATLHSRKIVLVLSENGRVAKYLWTRDEEPEERVTAVVAVEGPRIAFRGACPSGRDLEWDRYGFPGGVLVLFSTRDGKAAVFRRM